MNNDAWKAGVSPSSTARAHSSTAATTPVAVTANATTATATPTARPRGTVARSAGRSATRSAAKKAGRGNGGDRSRSGGTGHEQQICDTAPASPGSPASSQAARVSAAGPHDGIIAPVAVATTAVSTATVDCSAVSALVDSAACAAAAVAAAPWDEMFEGGDAGGRGDEDSTRAVENDTGAGDVGEELSDSLRLEPDIELEPGVDLKAELGLGVVGDVATELEDMALASDGSSSTAVEVEVEGKVVGGVDKCDVVGTGGHSGDLGFEIIYRDEAVGAALGDASNGSADGSPGTGGGRATRKSWPWAWGRTS